MTRSSRVAPLRALRPPAFFSRPRGIFVVTFALAFFATAVWSLATPLFAGSDEPAHVARAAALWSGQLAGTPLKSHAVYKSDAWTLVEVPRVYYDSPNCLFHAALPASCEHVSHSRVVITAPIYVGHYPPLYYLFVGLPTALTTSTASIYLMRLVGDLMSSIFIALAVMTVFRWSRRRFLFLGVLLALTPTTFYFISVINPNGLEISSALCLWCSGSVLALERSGHPPRGLVVVMTTSASVLLLTRQLSPLWVALTFLTLALVAEPGAIVLLLRRRDLQVAGLVVIGVTLVAVAWTLTQHSLAFPRNGPQVTPTEGNVFILREIFGNTGNLLRQMVGVFGWGESSAPLFTNLVWGIGIGALLLLAFVASPVRRAVVLALLAMLVILVPLVIQFSQARSIGLFIWGGRYTLPLAMGVPLLAAILVDRSGILARAQFRMGACIAVTVGSASFLAFAEVLRRYAVGESGPLDYLHGAWRPPFGALSLTIIYLLVTLLFAGLLWYLATHELPSDRSEALPHPTQ